MTPPADGHGTPRFELPALDLDFGRITDGTDIPPPPISPKVPTPPQTPPPDEEMEASVVKRNETDTSFSPNGNTIAGTKRPADVEPISPVGSARQGSLRRLFSRNMLRESYTEGHLPSSIDTESMNNSDRPPSREAGSTLGRRKSRRNSLFNLLRGGESRRSSIFVDDMNSYKKRPGPPPPMIPELSDLEKDEGSLGNDLFKNIK